MNIILWIVLGGIAGWLASVIMKTNSRQGLMGDIIMGIVGGVAGGFVMNMFGQPGVTGFNIYSLFVAVLGAVALIFLGRAFFSWR